MRTTRVASIVLFGCLTAPALAGDLPSGAELYDHLGCVNCHGADAKNPISKVVPKLAGKPADEVFSDARKILDGEGATEESKIMHAAFYSPSQCDHPP
ncbi:MAG: hypothetical protein ABFS23_04540, partial [Pseudomonadota bacterium]